MGSNGMQSAQNVETPAQKKARLLKAQQTKEGWMKTGSGDWISPDQMVVDSNGQLVKKDPATGLPSKSPSARVVNADGSAVRPEAIRAVNQDGTLKDGFGAQFDRLDPNSVESYNMLKQLATTEGPTKNAQTEMALAEQMRANSLDTAAAQSQGASKAALNQLAMRGGASSGAKAMMARQGAKDLLGARQGVQNQFNLAGLDINKRDEDRKLNLLQQFGQQEMAIKGGNVDIQNKQEAMNKQLQGQGIGNANQFMMDAYATENDKWAANKQAQATANSGGGGGGGGCCFIFLEARYGNGTMDAVVRRFRDENMTALNQRGYYKLSEILVPLMRKSPLIKAMVRFFMTDPLVMYGRAYYGTGSKLGYAFTPVKNFWLKAFEYLGQKHEFIRENGETV